MINKIILFLSLISWAQADVQLIPPSRHHQYTSFGFLTEDGDAAVLSKNALRAWGAVGASLAVIESDQNYAYFKNPQIIFFGSATAGFRLNDRLDTLLTETIDARVGLNFEFAINNNNRVLLGWTHQSGHISDNIDDPRLIGPNVGNELIQLRYIHDCNKFLRLGASLKPIIGSEPKMKFWGSNQFIEVMPWHENDDIRRFTPFMALGLEQYGVERVHLSTHVQLGAYIGSHFAVEHHSLIRAVIGYYNGVDPRLKLAQYKLAQSEFGYLGIMIGI